MLFVEFTLSGVTKIESFKEGKLGNSAALKLITELHNTRKQHPYFLHCDKIKRIEAKLEGLSSRAKSRYPLESELLKLKEDRAEWLKIEGYPDEMPPTIKLEIYRK